MCRCVCSTGIGVHQVLCHARVAPRDAYMRANAVATPRTKRKYNMRAADWSRMQQTRGLSAGPRRAERSRHREVRALLRRLAGCARSTRAPPRHNSPAEAHLPTFKINCRVYASRPRRPAAARGATQLQLKAHPASPLPQPARPPTHPLRLMRRALLKGEKA